MKFTKRPVTIDAIQWTGSNEKELKDFFGGKANTLLVVTAQGNIAINTLEGIICGSKGDWIIKGVKGEFYPCKPDIFAATYRPANEKPDYHTTIGEDGEYEIRNLEGIIVGEIKYYPDAVRIMAAINGETP